MSLPTLRPKLFGPTSEEDAARVADEQVGIEELFRAHAPAIASLGLSMLQSAEEADELVQDVFLKAWRALDRLKDRQEARPWLMTIAIRLARTRMRRRKLTRFLFRAESSESDQVPAQGALPEHRDMVRRLQILLLELPAELHIAWVLRYVHAETVEGVAQLCGWSLSTAKRRIYAAHALITQKLDAATVKGTIRP
jgi:RNA polymerase sigma-70 factor, ECF subfamily